MILKEVINYYEEQGLTALCWNYEDCNSSFSFSSLKSIHGYLNRLRHHLFSRYKEIYPLFDMPFSPKSKFSGDELNYIESISKNNGKFEISLLEASLLGDVCLSWESEERYICLIDKEKERILRPKWSYTQGPFFDIEDKWYRCGRHGKELKGEFYGSPEFRKRCHDYSEIEWSRPMPIYINAVNPKRPELGFFSLYDDLTMVSNFFEVDDDSGDYSDSKLRNFINDLSKIEGTVYFSFHSHSLTNVINTQGPGGSADIFCCHFFSISEPNPSRADFPEGKMCDAYSIHCKTY